MSITAILRLPDNIFFDIFTFYGEDVFSEPGGHRFWWLTLALVCRKWNTVIRSSPNHFLGKLRFGNDGSSQFLMNVSYRGGDSVASRLRRWKLSSIRVNYDLNQSSPSSGEDEDNILILLQHLERICCLRICAPLSTWRSIAATSLDPPISCTGIEYINFDTGNRETGLVLPSTFLAGNSPRLREFSMIGLFPPSLSSLLLFPSHLTTFVLDGIPDSSLLPPDVLLGHLGNMPQLRYLNVGFLSSVPHPHGRSRNGKKKAAIVQFNRVVLSNLRWFYFRGVCAYLEALVTRLDTPRVREIDFVLFHQLRFALPRISAFLKRTKRFGFDGIQIHFHPRIAAISAGLAIPSSAGEKLVIWLPCHRFDFQVASVSQICSALRPNFGNMEDMFIKYHQSQLPVEWHGQVDQGLWREIITHFHGMKTLWISSALVSGVTQAIRSSAHRLVEEMPFLTWIFVEVLGDDASIAAAQTLSDLLVKIHHSGGPVIEVYRLLPDMWNQRRPPTG
jgi:F-box-like